jgi:hypothetical protein
MSHEPQPGEVLGARFHVTDATARSTMTTLFKAADLKTGRPILFSDEDGVQ